MDDALKRRIADDLRKAGFESEMLAIERFVSRGWRCEGSIGYRDRDQDIGRELDLWARYGLSRSLPAGGSAQCSIQIAGEVKKTERPWVVLRERLLGDTEMIDAWANLTSGMNLPTDQFALAEPLSTYSLLQQNGWQARGIHESFKAPTATSASYGACISVCKAAESILEAEETSLTPLRTAFADSIFFTLIKPVIIVDGMLASASIADDGSIEVAEVKSAVLRFQFRTAHYTRQNYTVDLVVLQHLSSYLELAEQRVRYFLAALVEPPEPLAGGDK